MIGQEELTIGVMNMVVTPARDGKRRGVAMTA